MPRGRLRSDDAEEDDNIGQGHWKSLTLEKALDEAEKKVHSLHEMACLQARASTKIGVLTSPC